MELCTVNGIWHNEIIRMNLTEGTIKALQEHIGKKITERGFDDESLHERLLLLAEEVGELIHACRKTSGMYTDKNRPSDERPEEEIVDVLNLIFAVAIKMGVDVETEFIKKEAVIDTRTYGRTQENK